MSPESSSRSCTFEVTLGERACIKGVYELVELAILKQQEVAYEELGDDMLGPTELTKELVEDGTLPVDEGTAHKLVSALNTCLEARYLGLCTMQRCFGRPAMERRLATLGITRYKSDVMERDSV